MYFRFSDIKISDIAINKINKYQLKKQFIKAVNYIKNGNFKSIRFKLRKPKSKGIYYFRINKQYRALCKVNDNTLFIFDIDDHS